MKPLRLIMNAFGPFVTKQEINFTTLDGEEIFLVTGETGAGKTTIFDAMSFALYGKASGDSRSPGTFKSDHAEPGAVCFVEFEFALRGKRYFIRRTPPQRSLKRNGGVKELAPSAELSLTGGELITGANAVTEYVSRILGLNHRQFKQTIMLAQGEFKQLIEANGKEKQEIFSKIFGTSIYSDLTALLIREEAELARTTQASRDNIARCIRELSGYGYSALQGENAVFIPFSQISAIVQEGVSLFEARFSQLDEDISRIEVEKSKLNPENARLLNDKLDRRDNLRVQLTDLQSKTPEIDKLGQRLKLIATALELNAQEEIIMASKHQSEALDREIAQLEIRLDALQKKELALSSGEASLAVTDLANRLDIHKIQYDKVYRAFLDSQSAFLAQSLQDGKPCPVCGSSHHPSPAAPAGSSPNEKAVDDAKKSVSALEKQLATAIESEKEALRIAKSDCEKCFVQLEAARSHKKSAAQQFETQRASFVEKLNLSGFSGYKDYRSTLESNTDIEKEKRRVEKHRECLIAMSAQLAELERDTENRSREDIDALLKASGELSKQLTAMRLEKSELYAAIQGTKKRMSELQTLFEENSENERRHTIARELAGLAKGNRTVSFERYILAAYFDDIIKFSNIHLQRMTGSRYRLRRLDDSERGTGSGLDMEIIDSYTGKPRDVSTLSGGESFKASLALALGLSGVVQMYAGGVSIDTMFIDEGFGSLDEKSLDSAIETLISLKKTGRMVGIISHVPALRGYIPRKLAVHYSPIGSSVNWL